MAEVLSEARNLEIRRFLEAKRVPLQPFIDEVLAAARRIEEAGGVEAFLAGTCDGAERKFDP